MTARARKKPSPASRSWRIIDAKPQPPARGAQGDREYYRLRRADKRLAASLKRMRHSLEGVEAVFGAAGAACEPGCGLGPFCECKPGPKSSPARAGGDVLRANFKRGQEAARVIEEFAKVSTAPALSEKAKALTVFPCIRSNGIFGVASA